LAIGGVLLAGATFGATTGAELLAGATSNTLRNWLIAGSLVSSLTVLLIIFLLWRTAQTTAIMRRAIAGVTIGNGMVAMPSHSTRAPLVAPAMLRMYGLRSAI